jgi:predicted SAM-dependent methyltransferase
MITLNTDPNGRYLDLGCGDNPHPACQVHVDCRPGPHINFTADFNEPLPIKDEDFDGVFNQFVIEHLSWRKVRQFVRELYRVTKPGGKVLTITANTKAQIEWIKSHPEGWDGMDDFESFSCILFGANDYPENTHRNYWDPDLAVKLFGEAGFEDITVQPYGPDRGPTDMAVIASKPAKKEEAPAITGAAAPATPFGRDYFNGKASGGGLTEAYRDSEANDIAFAEAMKRRPESVLELGAARGYLMKRLQGAGVRANGLEVSRHCWLTRACDGLINRDLCDTPWPFKDKEFDMVLGNAVLEHVPEADLPKVIAEMARVSRRCLLGIYPDGGCTSRPLDWWYQQFGEVFRSGYEGELVPGPLSPGPAPAALFEAGGRVKLNVGCFLTMHHHGWENIDIADLGAFANQHRYKFRQLDVRGGLPYGTGAVDLILANHFLDKLTYAEGARFLAECRRVLRPDGVVRVSVPDASLLQGYYLLDPGKLEEFHEISESCEKAPTPAGKLWALLHDGHQSCYDAATLSDAFRAAGFAPTPRAFREGDPTVLNETLDVLPCLSLYMEASPA